LNKQKTFLIHCGHILGLTAILYIPIGIFASKGLAPLFAIAVVFCLGLKIWQRQPFPWIVSLVLYALIILIGWSLISWFWSISPHDTLKTGISLAVTFLGGAILFGISLSFGPQEKKSLQNGIILGGFFGFSLIAIEFATNAGLARLLFYELALIKNPDMPSYSTFIFSVYGNSTPVMNAGMAATTVFFFPWAMTIKDRFSQKVFILIILVGAILVLMTYADAVKLSFVVGLIVFLTALAWPRWINRIMCVAITIGFLTAPLIPSLLPNPLVPSKNLEFFSPSSAHRILIWKNTVGHIKQNLILGSGLDTTRALYSAKDRILYDFPSTLSNGTAYKVLYEPIPLHPHNAVLQIWLELGAVGALISLGLLLTILYSINRGRLHQTDQAAALGLFAATLSLACISFGIWQGWWLSSILLSIAYFVSLLKKPLEKNTKDAPILPNKETGGPKGLEPTRYGDWERKGRAIDF
jgi:hypothetical protein